MFVEQVVAPDVPVVQQGRLLTALWRDRLRPWRPLVTLVQQRVATRIWSAIAIPGLAALLVIGLLDVKLIQDERSIAGMRHGIELAVAVHDLAHQLQAERGLAVLAGDAEAAGWRSQQTVSDGAGQRLTTRLADIPGALIAALGGPDQGVTAELATLDALRSRITGGGVGTATIIGGYSKIIENLIRLQESMQGLAVESEVGRAMAGLVALERAREAGEREAVTGSGVIAAGSVSPAARKRLMELAVEQQVRLSGFADGATPAQRVDFDAIEDSPANIELRRFRAVMTADAVAAETVAGWRAASRARLALVEAVADQVIARLRRGADQTKRAADLTLALYVGITLLATGLATILVVALARSITRPINHLTDTMRQLTAGQTDISVPVTRRADEIGELGRSVQLFKDSLVRSAQMADEQQRAQQQRVARAERIDGLTLSFDQLSAQAIGAIAGAAQGLKASAETLTATASDASEQAEAVAGAAGQASINVQTVATATEQLAASIHEIARQVTQSSMMARAAVQEADRSDRIVAGLATAAQQIGDVIGLIQTVARRTNMLALNATIEAVRAGESGRGFAVVASEVKSLANQTARASAEIAAQIAAVQRSTVEAVEVIGSIKNTINDIESVTAAIASAVEQQGAATSDIAHNVKQAAFGTGAVSGSIGAVSGAVSETGHVAHDVLNSGTELTRHCETLRAAVAQFLQAVNQS